MKELTLESKLALLREYDKRVNELLEQAESLALDAVRKHFNKPKAEIEAYDIYLFLSENPELVTALVGNSEAIQQAYEQVLEDL